MKIIIFISLFFVASLKVFAQDTMIDCSVKRKANQSYLECEDGIKGYAKDNQKINEIVLKYKTE